MVRISDILKQGSPAPEPDRPGKEKKEGVPSSDILQGQPQAEEPRGSPEKTEEGASRGIQFAKTMPQEQSLAEKEIQVAKAMHKMQIDPQESRDIYNRALEVIKEIFNKVKSDTSVDLREAYNTVEIITDRLVLGDKELIALTSGYSEDNYLYAHSINVCILSIYVGLGLGYNKSKLHELGLGALLHDLGMIKVTGIISQQRALNEHEYAQIKKHPVYSSDILSKIKDIQEGVLLVIEQTHERLNGKGYPKGVTGEQLSEYSKIVAVVDVYEALTHPRPHRKALSSHQAIKELLTMNSPSKLFDMAILKIFINRIGIYPVGSWVELSSGEIGKVASANDDSPLRPKVNIIFGPDRKRLAQIKIVDLVIRTNLFIKRTIDPKELNLQLE